MIWIVHALVWAFVVGAAIACGPARAEVYGLVIGVDDYGGPDDLAGAVADARDVATGLRNAGAKRTIMLLNSEARRQTILDTYKSLVDEAKPDDTLIVHYAGHGAQVPLRPGDVDTEGDGKDDVFVLGGFRTLGDSGELIVDKEVAGLLAEAGRKGVKVLFVADSCHSGGMARAVRPGLKYRNIDIVAPPSMSLHRGIAAPPPNDPALGSVTFLAAVPRNQKAPEISIEGVPRGALSYAFARALEGAGAQGARWLTPALLRRYVVPTVIALSEGQQAPQLAPLPPRETPLTPLPEAGVSTGPASRGKTAVLATRSIDAIPRVKLATINGAPPVSAPPQARLVETTDAPDLVWDRAARRLDHSVGGLAAEGVEEHDLPPIVAKWAALGFLKQSMSSGPPAADVVTGQQTYHRGDTVKFRFSGALYPYLTIFNLPPNGRVELLYPDPGRPGEADVDWRGRESVHSFVVDRPPFGAEHVVVVFSDEKLASLQSSLVRMNDRDVAIGLPVVLRDAFEGRRAQVGVLPIYTAP